MHLPSTPALYAAAALVGVSLHLTVFRVGEWQTHARGILVAAAALDAAAALALRYLVAHGPGSLWEAFSLASAALAALAAGLLASMAVYRAVFSPLNRFPGPFVARVTAWYATSLTLSKRQLFRGVQDLHRQHGDYVRLSPCELSILDPKAIQVLHSKRTSCSKGPWYDIVYPSRMLSMLRDEALHDKRRRVWDKALGTQYLRNYEPRIAKYTSCLVKRISESGGQPVDFTQLVNYFAFDVMGDVGFGLRFDSLACGKMSIFMEASRAVMIYLRWFGHVVWLSPLFRHLPMMNREYSRFEKWAVAEIDKKREARRQQSEPSEPFLFSRVLGDYDASGEPLTQQETMDLVGDAMLVVVAGSDTTAVVLQCLMMELCRHRRAMRCLQEELDACFAEHEQPGPLQLSKLKYLQACLDETMRLWPPVVSGLQRKAPEEGLWIGDVFVPGNTVVQCPSYALYRDERLFVQPDEFIPERWTTRPELISKVDEASSVFAPFSTGRHSCAGKQLALLELRLAVSEVVRRYDASLAPGQGADEFIEGLQDGVILTAPPLRLCFVERGGVSAA